MRVRGDSMERVTTKQAASELEMDLDTLQFLMRENRLPIGHSSYTSLLIYHSKKKILFWQTGS